MVVSNFFKSINKFKIDCVLNCVHGKGLEDGTLKIIGSGEMKDWLAGSKAEYHAEKDEILYIPEYHPHS